MASVVHVRLTMLCYPRLKVNKLRGVPAAEEE
jgi:hypothetical protein